jgi:hypothetical protein
MPQSLPFYEPFYPKDIGFYFLAVIVHNIANGRLFNGLFVELLPHLFA